MILVSSKSDIIRETLLSFLKEQGFSCSTLEDWGAVPKDLMGIIWDQGDDSPSNPLPCPVLLLTNHKKESSGSMRVLTKPISFGKLKDICQQWFEDQSIFFTVGDYKIFPKRRQAEDESTGHCHALTEKETEILVFLNKAQEPVSREDILQAVWGYHDYMDTHTLETHIYKLRKKLFPKHPENIIVTAERGYYLKKT